MAVTVGVTAGAIAASGITAARDTTCGVTAAASTGVDNDDLLAELGDTSSTVVSAVDASTLESGIVAPRSTGGVGSDEPERERDDAGVEDSDVLS